jgi:uracil-DNA glycosylase family 4
LTVEAEIREIFLHMRGLLKSYQEIGLGTPPLSTDVASTLTADESNIVPSGIRCAAKAEEDSGRAPELASLESVREYIGNCQRCKLHRSRTHLVFGEGSPDARLVFVGEGPGHDEDMAGRPFVGESGMLLTRIIENGMGLTRKEVYICNVVKCHPPKNRDPEKDEIEACIPFLKHQLRIIGPEVICSLGRIATQAFLGKDFKISLERGKWHSYAGIPLMPTFHPAYLLRNQSAKRHVWEDIKMLMKRMGLEVKKNG